MKFLGERESELKETISKMMGGADSLGGDEFVCWQKLSVRKGGLDQKALEAAFGDLSRFRKPDSTVLTLRVESRVQEAAL
jgi:hypothetical protein